MVFETDLLFNLMKTILTTTLTLGMMISLTDFRFPNRIVLWTYAAYLFYVVISSGLIIWLFGFPTLLTVFLLTITAPAVVITYILAKDHAMKAIFNYMTQIDLCLLLTIPVSFLNHGSKMFDLFMRAVLLSGMIAVNYCFIRKPFRRFADLLEGNWFFMALVPTVFCLLIFLTARFPVHFTQNPWSLVLLLAVAVVMLIVYFVIFQSLNNSYQLLTYEQEKKVLRTQVSAMKNRMETIKDQTYQADVYRHDLRHHANLLTGLLTEEKQAEALAYIQKLGSLTGEGKQKYYCENSVVNTILSLYLEQAQSAVVHCQAVIPERIGLDEMELCTALSNLLENAIEHCIGSPPTLSVLIRTNKNQLYIRIENSFDGVVKLDSNGQYRSAKPHGGIGIQSVRAIVKKHKGAMSISHENKIFTVDIAMTLHT